MAKKKQQSKRKKPAPKKVAKKAPTLKKAATRAPAAKATKAASDHGHGQADNNQTGNENKPLINYFTDEVKLKELTTIVRASTMQDQIWNTFNVAEQQGINAEWQRATDDGSINPNIVDLWARFKGISRRKAVLEIAYKVDLLTESNYHRLLRSFGLDTESAEGLRPEWDRALGVLRLGDTIIKRVRRLTVASNVALILTSFQEQVWPSYIDNPLLTDESLEQTSAQRLQDAIKSLNKNLETIRFRSTNCGRRIVWEHV